MKKVILLGLVFAVFFSFCGESGPKIFELTEVDIIDAGLKVNAGNITIRGINVNMKVSEVLNKLGIPKSHVKYNDVFDVYTLKPEPGFDIEIEGDGETIEKIHIYGNFRDMKGKTKEFFNLPNKNAVEKLLKENLGEPLKIRNEDIEGIGIICSFKYPGGIFYVYQFMEETSAPSNRITIMPIAQKEKGE